MDLEIDKMRHSGLILSKTLKFLVESYIAPGITTYDISEKAKEIITSYRGARPAFLGYRGFPGSACVSVNYQAVHGVPRRDVVLKEGDIVSVDCGVDYEGHFSDACRTIPVGKVSSRVAKLLKVTEEAMNRGIQAALPGNRIGDISYAIQKHVERHRFSVSRDLGGHGIGTVLHDSPWIANFGPPAQGDVISAGSCFAIEPVVFDGPVDLVLEEDKWTLLSVQNSLSAHFEETILITESGPDILTRQD